MSMFAMLNDGVCKYNGKSPAITKFNAKMRRIN